MHCPGQNAAVSCKNYRQLQVLWLLKKEDRKKKIQFSTHVDLQL